MAPGLKPARVVAIGLSPEETAAVSAALGGDPMVVSADRAKDFLASPDLDLGILNLTAAGELVPALLEAGSGDAPVPPLVVIYDPAQSEQVAQLSQVRPAHVLVRDGECVARLPLVVRAAAAAGRLFRERIRRFARRLSQLAEEKHRLESAVACMGEGLLVLDRDYRFATINPVARELLGVASLEELSARLRAGEIDPGLHPIFWLEAHDERAKPARCWEVLGCERRECPAFGSGLFPCWLYDGTGCRAQGPDRFPAKLVECYQCPVYQRNASVDHPARAQGQREVVVERPERKVMLSLSAPIVDDGGQFLGVVKLLRDVTTERLLQQLRAEFTSFMTHELRTPLTSISGFLHLVLTGHAGELNDAQRRQLLAAHRQAKRLERLVDNLLDMSEIEARRLELDVRRFDLMPMLVETVEVLRPQADEKKIALRVLPADEPVVVTADSTRLTQVLMNLIGNAIKYTDAGGVVSVGARHGDDGVVVEVGDTGCGIPADALPRVFDKYYRVPEHAAKGPKGSGLGLAICKGIVDAHGGRIWVESLRGQGSRFLFTIPPRMINATT